MRAGYIALCACAGAVALALPCDVPAQTAVPRMTAASAIKQITVAGPVASGATARGAIELAAPAAGAVTVTLTSSNPALLSVPGSIGIGAGATTQSFALKAGAVAGATDVTVTAQVPGSLAARSVVRVVPAAIGSLQCQPASVLDAGTTCQACLAGPAPSGAAIQFSGSPNVLTLTTPHHAPITSAGCASASFAGVASPVALQGAITAAYGGSSRSTQVAVPAQALRELKPSGLFQAVAATVTLTAPAPAGGLPLSITVDAPLQAPGSIVIPAGQTTAKLPITVPPVPAMVQPKVTVSTSYFGHHETRATTLTLNAADILKLEFPNGSTLSGVPLGGVDVPVAITLRSAGAGQVITLRYSGNATVSGPAQITVDGAASQATFTVRVQPCAVSSCSASVEARNSNSQMTKSLSVLP